MLEIRNLNKRYDEKVLDDISVQFPSCGLVAITGDSGCGKSTLLQIIGGLDQEYDGEVLLNGQNIKTIKNYIRKYIGFVFQNIYLINEMTVKNNYLIAAFFKKIFVKRKIRYLKQLGLNDLTTEKTALLSGGEKQRIAIMRSFIADNAIVLCDEPTGALDNQNSEQVFSILQNLAKERLVIVVSHDIELAKKYSHYLYRLEKGQLYLLQKRHIQKNILTEKKTHQSFFRLLLKLFKISLKSHLFLAQIIFISLFCILLTFSLTRSSRQHIQEQIEQIIPSTSIMCKRKDGQDISLENLRMFKQNYIQYRCMEYNDIEMMGLSMNKEMNINDILYVSDYIQPLNQKIEKGRQYQKDYEIVVSQNTYQHLCEQFKKKDILNQEIYLFIQNNETVLSVEVTIVGVTKNKTMLDTIYLHEYAYSHFCKQLFQIENGQMCFLQVDNSDDIDMLKKDYPQYQFQIANASLTTTIDEKMEQLENILLCFCLLIVISSCFLLGEVIYLNVVKKKKMFAIFKAMGASSLQITFVVLSQGLFISVIAFIQAVILLRQIVQFVNQMIVQIIPDISNDFFSIHYEILLLVFIFAMVMTIISCLIPVLKANKIDIIEGIKG